MKKVNCPHWGIVFFTVLALMTVGCRDNSRDTVLPSAGGAVKATLRLSLPQFSNKEVALRAELDEETESTVVDAIVAVFTPSGSLYDVQVYSRQDFMSPNTDAFNHQKTPLYRKNLQNNTYDPVKLEVFKEGTVAMLANTSSGFIGAIEGISDNIPSTGPDETIRTKIIEKVKTLSDFRKLKIRLASYNPGDERSLSFFSKSLPMYGEALVPKVSTASSSSSSAIDLLVPLKRLVSKVKLDLIVKTSDADKQKLKNVDLSFVPTSVQMVNMPANAYIGSVVDDALGAVAADDHPFFYNSIPDNFESLEVSGENANKTIVSSLSFYALPNTRTPQHSVSDYAQRDAWNKIETSDSYPGGGDNYQKNDGFKNAPIHGTYLVIKGTMDKSFNENEKKEAKKDRSYSADITSYVHLGYVGGILDNYELKPNVSYRYVMEINGVKTIITEVQSDEETRPGYEGHILLPDNDYVVDSHYDAVLLTFDKSLFTGPDKDNIDYLASTPFAEFNKADVHWIKFVSNRIEQKRRSDNPNLLPSIKYSDIDKLIVNYPGDDNVWTIEKLKDELLNPNSDIWTPGVNKAFITAYVNEFYYEKDPRHEDEPIDANFKNNGWKQFTNQPDRAFYIYIKDGSNPNGTKWSRDKMSSFTKPLVAIRQHSIQTFYPTDLTVDPNDSKQKYIALGFEKEQDPNRYINENNYPLEFGQDISKSFTNGRQNYWSILARNDDGFQSQVRFFNRKGGIINPNKIDDGSNRLQREYDDRNIILANPENAGLFNRFKARSACLAKNRDENGDGILQPEEMKWYLPSLGEIFTMYVADHMLPYPLRMIQTSSLDKYYHYITSTKLGQYMYNSAMFWMENGRFSRATWDPILSGSQSVGSQFIRFFYGSNFSTNDKGYPFFRCVRALGDLSNDYHINEYRKAFGIKKYEVLDFEPVTSLFQVVKRSSQKDHGYKMIVHLPKEALRPARVPRGSLPEHSQNSVWNYPRGAFDVAAECLNYPYREDYRQIPKEVSGDDQYRWSKKYIRNGLYDDPCTYYYYENSDRSDQGTWRMPNMRELTMMFMTLGVGNDGLPLTADNDVLTQRGFHLFNGGEYNAGAGYPCTTVYISATTLSRKDDLNNPNCPRAWRDGNDHEPVTYYMGYDAGAGTVPAPQANILNSNNINGYIRCVRDAE